jgi:hypothetical protein
MRLPTATRNRRARRLSSGVIHVLARSISLAGRCSDWPLLLDHQGATAYGVDARGDVIGTAFLPSAGRLHAVEWIPECRAIPLPAMFLPGLVTMVVAAAGAARLLHCETA